MTVDELLRRAETHRTIHANRMIALAGTSEGAAKGWETRKGGGGGGDATLQEATETSRPATLLERIKHKIGTVKDKVGAAVKRHQDREAEVERQVSKVRSGSAVFDNAARKEIRRELKEKERQKSAAAAQKIKDDASYAQYLATRK